MGGKVWGDFSSLSMIAKIDKHVWIKIEIGNMDNVVDYFCLLDG